MKNMFPGLHMKYVYANVTKKLNSQESPAVHGPLVALALRENPGLPEIGEKG